jgi:hypothetical protein
MGVTIHFEGRLRDEASYQRAVESARTFALAKGWPVETILEPLVTLKRVRGEEPWDYEGSTKGVALQPHENSDPLRLEFDSQLYVQEYCKTQFAPPEVHIQVVELLRLLEPEFVCLTVEDEGEYWSSKDRSTLEGHLAACFRALDDHLATDPRLTGPVRGPSGRIFDLVTRE